MASLSDPYAPSRFFVRWHEVLQQQCRIHQLDDFFHHGCSPDMVIKIKLSRGYFPCVSNYTLLTSMCETQCCDELIPLSCYRDDADDRDDAKMCAHENFQLQMVQYLLDHDANPNQCDPDHRQPLDLAIQSQNYKLILLLLHYGVEWNQPNVLNLFDKFTQSTYLVTELCQLLGVLATQDSFVSLLDVPYETEGGATILHMLMQWHRRTDIRSVLFQLQRLSVAPDWKLVDKFGNSPLHWIFDCDTTDDEDIILPDEDTVRVVLQLEPELIDMVNNDGETIVSLFKRKVKHRVAVKMEERQNQLLDGFDEIRYQMDMDVWQRSPGVQAELDEVKRRVRQETVGICELLCLYSL